MARRKRRSSGSGVLRSFARIGLMRFFGVTSPFALLMYLATYLGFKPLGNAANDPDSPEARARQVIEAAKGLGDALAGKAPRSPAPGAAAPGANAPPALPPLAFPGPAPAAPPSGDRGFGRTEAEGRSLPGPTPPRNEPARTEPPRIAVRPDPPAPPPPANATKPRGEFKGDFNPYR